MSPQNDGGLAVMDPQCDHPIILFFMGEIAADSMTCNCDDYEACEYEAD